MASQRLHWSRATCGSYGRCETDELEEMAVRYYEREHFDAYARIKEEGLHQWSDLHEELAGFEDFPNRPFLERTLSAVAPGQRSQVLEYGCGTGPAACFLAERGYDVHGIDLVPDAIEIIVASVQKDRLACVPH